MLAFVFVRPFFRIKFIGREKLPKGAYILCANHTSFFDPVVIGFCIRRRVCFMAKSEFFNGCGKFVSCFMTLCGVFPVKRNSADKACADRAGQLLKNGKIIGIFPQGKIVRDINSFDPKAGALLLASRFDVPVIPLSIYHEGRIRLFSKMTVRVCEPVYADDSSLKSARKAALKLKAVMLKGLEGRNEDNRC